MRREDLVGKFHSHVTVSGDDIGALEAACRARGMKATPIVDLGGDGRQRPQIMSTSYYKDNEKGAYERILNRLLKNAADLESLGFEVVRVKLEHEDLPTVDEFSEDCYREIHIRLEGVAEADLLAVGARMGLFCSMNPKHGGLFASFRMHEGTLENCELRTEEVLKALGAVGTVTEVKTETSVYDTNPDFDDWDDHE